MSHWVSGSGLIGCLYDSGPYFSRTRRDAIEEVLWPFQDLPEEDLAQARRDLVRHGIHYFKDRLEAGADYCEVSKHPGPCPPPPIEP